MQLYLAGPFFSEDQISEISAVEKALDNNKTISDYYSPRQHQEAENEMFTLPWANEIYHRDMEYLTAADAVVAIVDFVDDNVDSGTAFEIGAAIQMGKTVVVLQQKDNNLNLMITESLHAYLKTPSEVEKYNFNEMPESHYTGDVF